jgi:PAS domain S-box-containing protein
MTPQKLITSFLFSFFRKDYMVYNSERVDKVKARICDGVLMTLFVLSIPVLISSLLRSSEIGIKPVFFAHTFVAIIIWVTCLAIRVKIDIPYRFRASIVILAFYFIAVTSMLQFGLLAAASVWFIVVPALSVILFNTRAGLIMILVTIISFLVIATLDLNGFISLNVKDDGYQILLLEWINYSITYLLAGGVLFVAVSISKNSLMDSLSKTDSIAKELKLIIENAKKAGAIADAVQTAVNRSWLSIDFSPDGLILKANDNFVSHLGYSSSEDLVGKHHKIFCKSDYIKSSKYNSFWKNLADGKKQAGEFKRIKKDGSEIWINANYTPVIGADGKVFKIIKIASDISEMHKLRTASEAIAKELRQFLETANAPIFGTDSNGLVNEWNETSEKITGFSKEEVLGKDFVETYITKGYRKAIKQVFVNALKGKETANFEFSLFTKKGKRLMVLLNSSTRRNVAGEITGVLGVGQDITELVGYRSDLELKVDQRTLKLNEALKKEKELNELKSRFVSTASHEFRTPLSAINFAAGSMKKYWSKMKPIMIEKKLDKIENQVLHMTKLLDDVLIVGQTEAGEMRNQPLTLNLGNFIGEIIEEVYHSSQKAQKIVLVDTESLKSTDIFIDEKLGRNIFINLISNAVKFSPDAHQVTVELSSEKDHTIISVTDFGIGIPKSELEKIFMPFMRGKNVDLIQGTGLGLSIVKEAVDLIGGEIVINSKVGKGTTFMVKIPKI